MYAATATISVAIEKLKKFPGGVEEPLLIEARSNLVIARNLLENRWQIWNSIYWRRFNAATKRSVRDRLEGLAFDALAGVTNAGRLLNRYIGMVGILDENAPLWSEIIHCLHVRIQVKERGMREGIANSQEWAEIASRKKAIAERA